MALISGEAQDVPAAEGGGPWAKVAPFAQAARVRTRTSEPEPID